MFVLHFKKKNLKINFTLSDFLNYVKASLWESSSQRSSFLETLELFEAKLKKQNWYANICLCLSHTSVVSWSYNKWNAKGGLLTQSPFCAFYIAGE